MLGRRRIVVDHRGCVRANLCRMCTPDRKCRGRDPSSDITHQRRAEDDHRKGNGERKNRDKSERRDDPQRGMLQRARSDAPRRLQHDRNDCGLDAVEHAAYRRHVAIRHVQPGQADEQHERRQDEQAARNDPTPRPVQQPADVRRQLLRFRTRKDHAEIECVQEALLGNPALLVDQFAMHQRDLPGGTAEADATQPQPVSKRFAASRRARRIARWNTFALGAARRAHRALRACRVAGPRARGVLYALVNSKQ